MKPLLRLMSLPVVAGLALGLSAAAMAEQKSMKTCNDEYAANKKKITARGLTRLDFLAECRLSAESQPAPAPPAATAAAAPPAAEPVPPDAAAAPTPVAAPAAAVAADAGPFTLVTYVGGSGGFTVTGIARFGSRDACAKAAGAVSAELKPAVDIAKLGCMPSGAFEPASRAASVQ